MGGGPQTQKGNMNNLNHSRTLAARLFAAAAATYIQNAVDAALAGERFCQS